MARIVRIDAAAPIKIETAQFPRDDTGNLKPIWICACGLTCRPPFCDASHKVCREEEPGHVYRYEPQTNRVIEKKPG